MTDRPSIAKAAQAYLSAGLCVLSAIRAEKRPAVGRWKQYQKRRPTPAELSAWMANRPDAVCILCGVASNHAEIIDFDGGGELFSAWWDRIPADLRERLVVERTPSGGWHVIYRCIVAVCGNLKLAQRRVGEKIVTLIETRGEGGLFLCAPTAGYEITQGDLCDLPVLTEAERDLLLQAAWDLNECPPDSGIVGQRSVLSVGQCEISADNSNNGGCPPETAHMCDCPSDHGHGQPGCADILNVWRTSADDADHRHGPSHNAHITQMSADNADRPGDEFNIRGDVRAVLRNAGWVRVKAGENEYWRRPGKDSGTSATLKDRVFYVFSSMTDMAWSRPSRMRSCVAVTLKNRSFSICWTFWPAIRTGRSAWRWPACCICSTTRPAADWRPSSAKTPTATSGAMPNEVWPVSGRRVEPRAANRMSVGAIPNDWMS